MTHFLSEKDPVETVSCTMDFSPILNAGETISSHSCAVTAYVGASSTSGMFVGGTSLNGSTVAQTVSGGAQGAVYRLRYTITTNQSRTLTASSFLPVDEDNS